MDDLGQIIFVVLFILFGLISSSKKKKGPPKPGTRARQVPRDAARPSGAAQNRSREQEAAPVGTDLPIQPEGPSVSDRMLRPKAALADELLVLLKGQTEPESEAAATLPEVDDEAQSLETLEPAGQESHERFSERYVEEIPIRRPYALTDPTAARPYAIQETPAERPYLIEEVTTARPYAVHETFKKRKRLTRRELRHAFVMREVLGPPKALEE